MGKSASIFVVKKNSDFFFLPISKNIVAEFFNMSHLSKLALVILLISPQILMLLSFSLIKFVHEFL